MTETIIVPKTRGRIAIPLIVGGAILMEQIDSSSITVAIPTMAAEFGVDSLRLNLVVTSYLFALAIFIPASGWLAERFGPRRIFICGIVLFVLSSLLCACATSLPMLTGARVLQGLGGALMTPTGRLILLQSFSKSELLSAISFMTMPVLAGPVIGPLIGGLIIDATSWRYIFLINIPFGIIALVCALKFIEPIAGRKMPRFDARGFALCGTALLLIQLALENVSLGFLSTPVGWACLFVGTVTGYVFWRWASRVKAPLLDPALFKIRPFRLGVLAGGLSRIGLQSVPFLFLLQLQLQYGYEAAEAGAIVAASAIGALVLKPFTKSVVRALGFKLALIANAITGAVLIAGFSLFDVHASGWTLLAYSFAFGLVRSLHFNTINSLTYAEVPHASQSKSISLGVAAQQLSMAMGISIASVAISIIDKGRFGDAPDFAPAFLLMSVFPLLSALGFVRLDKHDGSDVSGRPHPRKPHA